MPKTELEFPQVLDSEFASQAELDGVKEDDNPGAFVQATMNNYDLWLRVNSIDNRANDSNPVFFSPSGSDYIQCDSTSYEVRANIVYRGTDVWTPNMLIVLASRSKASGTGYFRVYDYSNAQEICERTFTDTAKTIHTFNLTPSEISLLPSGLSILEFQLKQSSSSAGKTYLHAAGLYTTT